MSDKHFDDILRESMDTPRNIPFDEGMWARMEESMPVQSSPWSDWMKFVPFMTAIAGLLIWNIYLQRQANHLSQKYNNIVVEKVENSPETQPTKVIYVKDTVYQVVEKQITDRQIQAYVEQYLAKTNVSYTQKNLSHTQKNPLYNPNHSLVTPSSSFMTPNNHSDRPSSIGNDGQRNSPNSILGTKNVDDRTSNPLDSNVFALRETEETEQLGEAVQYDNIAVNPIEVEDEGSVVAENATIEKEELKELATIELKEVKHYLNLSLNDRIDMASLYHPKSPKDLKLRERLFFDDFKIGASTFASTSLGTYNSLSNFGLHARSYILPNLSLHLDVLGGTSYATHYTGFGTQTFFDNPYPHPEPHQIPASHSLERINVNMNFVQAGLTLRRIWYKDEHIRPYAELGWMPYYETNGLVGYDYSLEENGIYSLASLDYIPVDRTNTDLKWNFSPIALGAGLSSNFFNKKVELDIGLKYLINASVRDWFFQPYGNSAVGLSVSLGYCF